MEGLSSNGVNHRAFFIRGFLYLKVNDLVMGAFLIAYRAANHHCELWETILFIVLPEMVEPFQFFSRDCFGFSWASLQ